MATVAAHQLPEVPEPSQWEIVTTQNGHPIKVTLKQEWVLLPGSWLTGREPAAWRTSRGAAGSRNAVADAAAIKGERSLRKLH